MDLPRVLLHLCRTGLVSDHLAVEKTDRCQRRAELTVRGHDPSAQPLTATYRILWSELLVGMWSSTEHLGRPVPLLWNLLRDEFVTSRRQGVRNHAHAKLLDAERRVVHPPSLVHVNYVLVVSLVVIYSLSMKVDRKSTRLNSSHSTLSRMPSSA